jgi:hypothetical protein
VSSSKAQTSALVEALMADPKRREDHTFLQNVDMDRVVAALLRLTMEVSVLRDRLDTYERLGAAGKPVTPDTVEEFVPAPADEAVRLERRKQLIARLVRDLS